MRRMASLLGLALLGGALARAALAPGFQRGICIEGGPELRAELARSLVDLGATHVSLNPFGWIEAPDVPRVHIAKSRRGGSSHRWWGESDDGLLQYTRVAREQGLKVMLRPHLWLSSTTDKRGRTGLWLGDVGFDSPAEWESFFASYREMCLHYARLAEQAGMEWYSVGAELTRATLEHPQRWRALIAEVRTVYKGKLTYSANWYREAEGIEFWDALDAVGVQAYFPVGKSPESTEDEMVQGWRPHLEMLRKVSETSGRPVIFTEIGYKPTAHGAVRPWEWGEQGPERPEIQARAYRAALRAVEAAPHVAGMYWWKFHIGSVEEIGTGQAAAETTGYSWQGREAEGVLREAYRAGR